MIWTINELRAIDPLFVGIPDDKLLRAIVAVECVIRKYTNNNFQEQRARVLCANSGEDFYGMSPYFKVGQTVQVTKSINEGLYHITDVDTYLQLELDDPDDLLYDEPSNLVTLVRYPRCVKEGALELLIWKFQDGDIHIEGAIQSETLGVHSVTYFNPRETPDAHRYLDGFPVDLMKTLEPYRKMRY